MFEKHTFSVVGVHYIGLAVTNLLHIWMYNIEPFQRLKVDPGT